MCANPISTQCMWPQCGLGNSGLTRDRLRAFTYVGAAICKPLSVGMLAVGYTSGVMMDRAPWRGMNDEIGIHEGPLPKGGEGMRASGSERWCSLTHKTAGLCGQREETPHQPPAPYSRGARKCVPHLSASARKSASAGGDCGQLSSSWREWPLSDLGLDRRRHFPRCKCGRAATHRGMCRHRLQRGAA